jgi:hypothetical protein
MIVQVEVEVPFRDCSDKESRLVGRRKQKVWTSGESLHPLQFLLEALHRRACLRKHRHSPYASAGFAFLAQCTAQN